MKCKCCGANVSLEDEFCPYCGALNEQARKHIRDMKKFSEDYEDTKEEVISNVEKQSRKHANTIAAIVLIVANLLILVCNFNISGIRDFRDTMIVKMHADEYRETLLRLEEDEKFSELNAFYSQNYLFTIDKLKDFYLVSEMAYDYEELMEHSYYLNYECDSYFSENTSETLSRLASDIVGYYDNLESMEYDYYKDMISGTHEAAIKELCHRTEMILKNDLKFTDEEIQSMADMDQLDIALMLQKKVNGDE